MSYLPSDEEQAWLLDQLRHLIASRGYETFVNAPILEPSDAYFPDPFSRDTRGIYVLARRLLIYAGLGHLDVQVQIFADGASEETPHGGERETVAWFGGIENGRCSFGANLNLLRDVEPLPSAMAHEVSHAFRTFHGIRTPDQVEEELLTDLTTIYLGFGVLTTNTSYLYRSSGHIEGSKTVTRWSQRRFGYLPPQALSFLLAAQAVARELSPRSRRHLAGLLERNQAAYFRAAVKQLSRTDGELARRLAIPPRNVWPAAPALRDLAQPLDRVPDPASFPALPVPLQPDRRERNRGRMVFRVRSTHAFGQTIFGGLGGFMAAILLDAPTMSPWAWLVVPVGLALGWLNGRVTPRCYCSDPECAAPLGLEVTSCPGCGGRAAGDIARPGDRRAAEDRMRELEREHDDRPETGNGDPILRQCSLRRL